MAPTPEERIKTLKSRREAFKLEVDQFKGVLDAHELGSSISEVKIRFDEVESEYAVFCKTQSDLDTTDDTGELLLERVTLKSLYATYKARAIDIMNVGAVSRSGNASGRESLNNRESPLSQGDTVNGDVRLPKLDLPTFSGAYEDWPGFSDQFKSSVHDKGRIDDCKKLMYLRSCLKDEAAKDIKSLGNSANNYKVAWDILEKRYNQPAIIVANHLQSLFKAPLLQKSNHREFRTFISTTEAHYRSLQVLKQPTADTILIHLLLSKLDKEMVVKWKEHKREDPFPAMDKFFEFLHDRCNVSEPLNKGESAGVASTSQSFNNRARPGPQGRNKPPGRELRSNTHVLVSQPMKCNFCTGSHLSHNCDKFVNMSVAERFKLVKEKHLCYNCFRVSHSAMDCQASTCRQCHKRHHTLLHFETTQTPQPVQVNNTCSIGTNPSQIMFGTAVIDIIDRFGKANPCRVLLDSCAASHFLSEKMCKLLELNTQSSSIQLRGTNAMSSAVNKVACAEIKSRYSQFATTVTFLVVKEVSQPMPQENIDRDLLHIPAGIQLADPNFHIPGEIDALIGGQFFWDLLCVGRKTLANQVTKLQKTQLGWVVVGQLPTRQPGTETNCNLTLETLQADVHNFWTIEECPSVKLFSPEEQACEDYYQATTTRDSVSGRYTVSLPFNSNKDNLGESYPLVLKRFLSLERSLSRNLSTNIQYVEFLREYEHLGHMTEIIEDHASGCYLAHHPVVKVDSITTKVRVVFDASARSSSGFSLNDTLMIGPTIQDDLVSLITRFRFHKYVLTADIAKMYRQVSLNENDRKYHKILWRENLNGPIKTYQLNTVTYGTASAPYLAIRTLHRLAQDEMSDYPRAADILLKDFYVDDVLTGVSSITDAIAIQDELIALTAKGGFQLRQWMSNDPRLIERFEATNPTEHMVLNEVDGKKTLGLYWGARQDTLGYTVKRLEPLPRVTKRTILSRVAQLFDPLGLLGPVIVQGKLIIQALWKSRLDWDELVPLDIQTSWVTFQSQLDLIAKVYVAVFVCFSTRAVHIELVSDLTTDAFLAALKRFIARRGKCTDVYSDNGTNFVGADRELKRIYQEISAESPDNKVYNYLLNQQVRWHFIPPRAPHFGGLWEAAVKSLKHHLVRIFGNTLLTYEEFTTCLVEVEAMLNSRPLTPLSSDPNDLVPLTPGHFLIGDSLTGTPECDLTCVKTGRLSSWQHLQQLRQHFWARWYKEYLNELTVRRKWHDDHVTQITVGMLVILKEDNAPPLCWAMGRITAIHPGQDGVVRVVTVKTTGGEYKRSVKKLAPLFADEI